MQIQRKIQVGALSVAINGLLAMMVLSPEARADSCTTTQLNLCICQTLAGCQALAPPGCTAVSATCYQLPCPQNPTEPLMICKYQ